MDRFLLQFSSLVNIPSHNQISLGPEDQLCARIADNVYADTAHRFPTIGSFVRVLSFDTPEHALFVDQEANICIIGYRGTEVSEIKDILSDIQIVLGVSGIDPRVSRSREMFDAVRRTFEGYQYRVTGHSLGGTLSYLVAKHRWVDRCVVFNPGSAPNALFVNFLTDTMRHASWVQPIITHKILGDIVSTCSYVGNTHTYTLSLSDPLTLHKMGHFIPSTDNKIIISTGK